MIEFIIWTLVLLVVAPTALVFGLKLAWTFIKLFFKRMLTALEKWLIKNNL